jgi:hypothetical protein
MAELMLEHAQATQALWVRVAVLWVVVLAIIAYLLFR